MGWFKKGKLPKEKQVKKLEEQDKLLEILPDPKEEKKLLKRAGQRLKHMIRHRSVKAKVKKIKKEEHQDIKEIKKEEKLEKKRNAAKKKSKDAKKQSKVKK